MMYGVAAQTLLFNTLNGNISATVFDDVPDQPPGMPEDSFPYVVIGYDYLEPFDTDDNLGAEVTCDIHVWSIYEGKKEIKTIFEEIYGLLHRQSLSITGAKVIDCLHTYSTIPTLGAERYLHGITRYRLTIMETS